MAAAFKHRCVQDLAWVISSPPLISGKIDDVHWWDNDWFVGEFQACYALLLELDKQPFPLFEAISSAKSKRLGHYFETLIAYWLEISPNYELLLTSHQLRTSGKTLGEIDFLIYEKATGKNIHLEVSVKFYLGVDNLNDMANWHGPGLRDRLDRKFNHLRDHQTKLPEKYPDLMPYPVDESACIIKGRLFYPPHTQPGTTFTSGEHLSGHWYQLPDKPTLTHNMAQLGKQNWMAEIGLPDHSAITELPDNLNEATLFVDFEQNIHRAENSERKRFFLLPEEFWNRLETSD